MANHPMLKRFGISGSGIHDRSTIDLSLSPRSYSEPLQCHHFGFIRNGCWVTLRAMSGLFEPQQSRSLRQLLKKLASIHSVFERLSPVNENYRNFIVKSLLQLWVGINIHFAPLELGIALRLRERLLDYLAKMTSLARIDDYFVHKRPPTLHDRADRAKNTQLRVVPLN